MREHYPLSRAELSVVLGKDVGSVVDFAPTIFVTPLSVQIIEIKISRNRILQPWKEDVAW